MATHQCACGFRSHPSRRCTCSEAEIDRYRARVSGPLLDRIDITISMVPVPYTTLRGGPSESSAAIRERVLAARARTNGTVNSLLSPETIRHMRPLKPPAESLLESAVETLGISARAYARTLRVAKTLSDLEGSSRVEEAHIAEALSYRVTDRVADT